MIRVHAVSIFCLAPLCFLSMAAQSSGSKSAARVDQLMCEMTVQEKIYLIRGALEPAATNQRQGGYLQGIPRLGIPPLRLADGPPGVLTRVPSAAPVATMGMAATFSRDDALMNGVMI